jgi:hypothetical protein
MALVGLFSLALPVAAAAQVLRPLAGVHEACWLQAGQALPRLPHSAVREVVVLGEALSTLAATMTENELVRISWPSRPTTTA